MASKTLLEAGLTTQDPTRIDKLGMLHHVRWIDKRLDRLFKAIEEGDTTGVRYTALNIKDDVAGLKMHHSNMIETIRYNEYLPRGCMAPARVFAIPELLENILENVEFYDLMRCYHVNRMFRAVVDQSKKCQIELFLRPTPSSSPFRPLPLDFPTFGVDFQYISSNRRQIRIEITKLPTAMGSRWRNMFISNPPMKQLGVRVGWQRGQNSHARYYMPYDLESDVGVTVGDIYDEARRVLARYGWQESMWIEFVWRMVESI